MCVANLFEFTVYGKYKFKYFKIYCSLAAVDTKRDIILLIRYDIYGFCISANIIYCISAIFLLHGNKKVYPISKVRFNFGDAIVEIFLQNKR